MRENNQKIQLQSFGQHCRKLRLSLQKTQKDIAFAADIDVSKISKIEHGMVNPTLSTLLVLARALEIHPAALLEFERAPTIAS